MGCGEGNEEIEGLLLFRTLLDKGAGPIADAVGGVAALGGGRSVLLNDAVGVGRGVGVVTSSSLEASQEIIEAALVGMENGSILSNITGNGLNTTICAAESTEIAGSL